MSERQLVATVYSKENGLDIEFASEESKELFFKFLSVKPDYELGKAQEFEKSRGNHHAKDQATNRDCPP